MKVKKAYETLKIKDPVKLDSGKYIRVGELSSKSSKKDLNKNYTLKGAVKEVKKKVKASR